MKRFNKSRLLLLVALATVAGFGWLGVEMWTARQPIGADFSEEAARISGDVPEAPQRPIVPAGPVRLAIGSLGLNDPAMDGAVADLMAAELSHDKVFQLVERREFARILGEIELGAAGAIKPADAIRLGRLLKADWFVLGSAYRAGTQSSSVVRVVDATSGIVRDLLVLQGSQDPTRAATSLVALLQRQGAGGKAATELPEFVAVGGFEDLSLRPRHAGVEAEIRNHLTTTLAGGPMIVLERELTRLLLDEIRLQQAGLLESTNPIPRLQSTFWLVDGFWQSFDSVGDEIDLTLRVSRIGGAVTRRHLRAQKGAALESAVATAMQELIRKQPEAARPPTRKGEIRAQLALGQERSGLTDDDLEAHRWYMKLAYLPWNESEETTARRRENYLAAMQAFESVLLLDPDHAFAKLYLARCLVDTSINRPEEAMDLYRELVGHKSGRVSWLAKDSLGFAYLLHREPSRAVEWFGGLLAKASESDRRHVQYLLDQATERLSIETASPASPARLEKEDRLVKEVRAWRDAALAGRPFPENAVFKRFLDGRDEGQKQLVELFPKLAAAAPELKPHLVVRLIRSDSSTNNPLITELEGVLKVAKENPKGVVRPEVFFSELTERLRWVGEPALRPLSALVADTLTAGEAAGVPIDLMPVQLARMGYAYLEVRRWEDALARFQRITNQIVAMDGHGPWGIYPAYIAPVFRVRQCLRELGRPVPADPTLVPPPEPVASFNQEFLFLPDGGRLWVTYGDQLVEQPASGGAGVTNRLGVSPDLSPQALVQSAETLWIGTAENGLVRVDKATRQVQRYTTAEGLLFDGVRALHLDKDRLWIGCASDKSGGVSVMDLDSQKVRSFTPALAKPSQNPFPDDWAEEADLTAAPRRPVMALAGGGPDELWVGVFGVGLQRFVPSSSAWKNRVRREDFPAVECLAVSKDWVVMGEAPFPVQRRNTRLLTILPHGTTNAVHLGPADGLPYNSVSTVALDGDRLWVGGPCYLAVLDLNSRKILKRCLANIGAPNRFNIEDDRVRRAVADALPRRAVSQLAIEGENVWVRLSRSIYRFPRSLAKEGN